MIDHRGYTHIVKLKPEKNSPGDQFTVGLIAQLVEHCTGIVEVMGWNQIGLNFFQALISQLLN